jgi:glycosyltransferase involved in cell wall biosynthesis
MQRARINVVPVANQTTASGQVTMLDAMMFGRAVIITSCPASVDYVTDGVDAMLVRHGDQADLKAAIERLWSDQGLRESIGVAARRTALETFSEAVVGRIMANVLQEVAVRQ